MKQLDEKLTPNTVAAPRHSYRLLTTSNSQWACGAFRKHEMTDTPTSPPKKKKTAALTSTSLGQTFAINKTN